MPKKDIVKGFTRLILIGTITGKGLVSVYESMNSYDQKIIDRISEILIRKAETIAVAESVTSGHIQAALSSATEAGRFYQGGISTYNTAQKTKHLGVEPIHAEAVNAVSARVSEEMAVGVQRLFLSDYGIGITGYATLMPEQNINDLFAWMSIVYHGENLITLKITSEKPDSFQAQIDYTNQVLKQLNNLLDKR